jgi:ABC-type spermidine/putrescine transport system permease subunit I
LKRTSAGLALLAPPLVLFLLFFVAPLLSLFWASLHTASDNELYGPALTTAHYATILTDPFYHTSSCARSAPVPSSCCSASYLATQPPTCWRHCRRDDDCCCSPFWYCR